MARSIHLKPHLSTDELQSRYRRTQEPVERSHWASSGSWRRQDVWRRISVEDDRRLLIRDGGRLSRYHTPPFLLAHIDAGETDVSAHFATGRVCEHTQGAPGDDGAGVIDAYVDLVIRDRDKMKGIHDRK